MEPSHSYSPTWDDMPSCAQTPLIGSHHPAWHSCTFDSFNDASPTSASYPNTPTSWGSSSNSQNLTPIYYGTYGQQTLPYSVPYLFHSMPVQPNYFHINQSMGYTPTLPSPLQNAQSTILNTPHAVPSTTFANEKKCAATTDGVGACKKCKKAPEVLPVTMDLSGSTTSPHCGVGLSPVSMPPPSGVVPTIQIIKPWPRPGRPCA